MNGINWAAVHPNNEPRPAVPVITPYNPAAGDDLTTLAEHLVTDHGYAPENTTLPGATPDQEWAMLQRLHWSALILSAPVTLNTPGANPS